MGCCQSKENPQLEFDDIKDKENRRPRPSPSPPESNQLKYERTDVGTYEAFIDTRPRHHGPQRAERPRVPRGELYTDEDFPLDEAIENSQDMLWRRPKDIAPHPTLFTEGTTRFDIGQGNPGTCWFLSILSSISEHPDFFNRVLTHDSYNTDPQKYDGIFHCRFWRFGQWYDTYIDDYLPIKRGGDGYFLWCAKSATDRNEMWVSLIEKAFAKFHGSYNDVYGGQPSESYLALSGGVSERIVFEDREIDPLRLFQRIRNALNSGAIVSCAVLDNYKGLVGRHAYSLTGAKMVETRYGDRVCLLRVRNPWGRVEWEGDWSDKSTLWSNVTRDSMVPPKNDEGEFWISIDDFCQHFFQLTICSITPDVDMDGRSDNLNYVTCIYGEWKDESAAGYRYYRNNPRFTFTIPRDTRSMNRDIPVVIQLIQERQSRKTSDTESINLYLYKKGRMSLEEIAPKLKSPFIKAPQIVQRYSLDPGVYVCLPSTYNSGVEKEFVVRIFTAGELSDVGKT